MTLEHRLREAAPGLTDRVVAEMYADPFWMARFGERGKKHAQTDGDFHFKYLIEALAVGQVGLFATYARWLRELLVGHGMCSHHLADNFLRLAAAIGDQGWPDGDRAIAVLVHGARSLDHDAGEAGALDAVRPRLAALAAARTDAVPPAELTTLLSYLSDACQAGASSRLLAYVEHARGRGRGPALDQALTALIDVIGAELPEAGQALGYLDAARTRGSDGG